MNTGAGAERGRPANRRRLLTGVASVAGHLAILAAVLAVHGDPPARAVEPETMAVQLVAPRPEPPAMKPDRAGPGPPKPATATSPPPRLKARPARRPTTQPAVVIGGPPNNQPAEVSEAALAQATTAGGGGGGGEGGAGGRPCDMVRRLQNALRRDARVQAAVAEARGASSKAMLVWNGDWIRADGQDGAGLAALREAIIWEVGFAPEACRAEPVRGLVLISLADRPGAGRLVVGAERWRWSDLLQSHARPAG